MRIISVINQKGGVGKTTTTANLAYALAMAGKDVVMIDMDPQGHLAASFNINVSEQGGLDDVFLHGTDIESKLIDVRERLRLLPAGTRLSKVESSKSKSIHSGLMLKKAIRDKFKNVDYLLIDCPPSSGLLVVNALLATEEVLVPVNGDYLSLEGLAYLMGTFKKFDEKLGCNPKQKLVMTRYQTRRRLPTEVLEKMRRYFPNKVLPTKIRETAALAECPGKGKSIFEYRKKSHGAEDYSSLANDIINDYVM